jgi:putative hydrolase of the HAD superfamily
VIEAVLFDWTNTLVELEWDDARVEEGHRAALGYADPAFSGRWRELIFGDHGHRPYAEILTELGVADPDAFIDAEHEVWRPAYTVLAAANALLDSLRARGVKTALVANAWPDPGRILRGDAESFGFAERLDLMVFSEELGVRKPEPEIFLHAVRGLGVDPEAAMYVGDDLVNDVQGAAGVGMSTVQAMWFRADDSPQPIEPDFLAFTAMDVLNIVRRLA